MDTVINAKTLRSQFADIMDRLRKGERFTVLYRSRPICRITPADVVQDAAGDLEEDSVYQAPALGRSRDGRTSADHDEILYGLRR